MSATWNGQPIFTPDRGEESVASRCMRIIERGMRRFGMERAPAVMNQMLVAPAELASPLERRHMTAKRAAVAAFLAEWRATPEYIRSLGKIAKAHKLGRVPAKQALIEAGLMAPPKNNRALRAAE